MRPKRRRSILRKLTLMNMLVSGAALSLACLAFFTYDQITFRQGLVRTLSAQADIVGSNSVSAILFNDPQSASNTLSALKSSQSVTTAGIFTLDGKPFATYARDNGVRYPKPSEYSGKSSGDLSLLQLSSCTRAQDHVSGQTCGVGLHSCRSAGKSTSG